MKMKNLIAILCAMLLIAACAPVQEQSNTQPPVSEAGLKKFESTAQLKDYLRSHQSAPNYYRGGVMLSAMDSVAPTAMESGAGAKGASDYSQTNVQVQGVDEADFVKNDGKYIYTLTANVLTIVDA